MLSRIIEWFTKNSCLWRLIMHIPVGFLGGALFAGGVLFLISFPHSEISVAFAVLLSTCSYLWWAAFREYELNEDGHLKDGAYFDIAGWLAGYAIAVLLGAAVVWKLIPDAL